MAKRQSTSTRRKSGGSQAEAEDVFVAKVVEYSTWARRNTQTLILTGVVLVVIVAGLIYYVNFRESRDLQAVQRLEQVQVTANFGDPETAKAELTQYIDNFGSTPYAAEARMLLAELYLDSDQAPQAVETLEAADVSTSQPMWVEVENLLAKAYEAAGQLEQAETTFLAVADRAEMDFQRNNALSDAARIRLERGNASGAVELYDRILDRIEDQDPERGQYEMLRAEARARANS